MLLNTSLNIKGEPIVDHRVTLLDLEKYNCCEVFRKN